MKLLRSLSALVTAAAIYVATAHGQKTSALPTLTTAAADDRIVIYDTSAATNKTIEVGNLSLSITPTWSTIAGKPTTLSGYGITDAQGLASDLTAIAALTTTTFGRSLLTQASATAALNTLSAGAPNILSATQLSALGNSNGPTYYSGLTIGHRDSGTMTTQIYGFDGKLQFYLNGAVRMTIGSDGALQLGGASVLTTASTIATNKGGAPSGGSTGQVLTKSSGTNYDYAWATPSGGGGGGAAAKLVNVTSPTARRALTAGEVNVGDIVRTKLSDLTQEAYDLTVDATVPTPGQVVVDIGDGNVLYAIVDGLGTAPESGSAVPVYFTASDTAADMASAVASALSGSGFYFAATVDGSDPALVHIVSTYPSDRTNLGAMWSITQVGSYAPAAYEKHLVIDTANLSSDALGFAKFAND